MKNTWFTGQFLPSICERMNNPKYPRSAILSAGQADVCRKYMHAVQCYNGDYGYFTVYELDVDGVTFTMTSRGRYTFLSRSMTKAELEEWEAQQASKKAEKEDTRFQLLVKRAILHPDRFKMNFQMASEQLERAREAYTAIINDPEADADEIRYANDDLKEAEKEVEKFIKAIKAANNND